VPVSRALLDTLVGGVHEPCGSCGRTWLAPCA
jgi:hypothetical protein